MKPQNSKFYIPNSRAGQSLIEVLIAVSIGALIVGSAAGALIFTVRSNQQSRATDTASTLTQEILDQIRSVSEGSWQSLYDIAEWNGTGNPCPTYCYYLDTSLNIVAGSEQKTVNNITYARYFFVENVNRDNCGSGNINASTGGACSGLPGDVVEDPSTQKVTAKVTWPQGGDIAEILISEYLTRSKNEVNQFSDWTGGGGVEGPLTQPGTGYSSQSGLDTTESIMLLE